jgi:uncharacterized low-complexity protein
VEGDGSPALRVKKNQRHHYFREIIMAHFKKPLAAALGAAFLATSVAPLATAAANPFSAQQLNGGYDLPNFDKHEEGSCGDKAGEGSCGDKAKEGSCGEKAKEGSCGDKAKEGSCGDKAEQGSDAGEKAGEGKCGEGKCGGS